MSTTKTMQTTKTRDAWDAVAHHQHLPTLTLGPIHADSIVRDPKHLGFVLARYKFAAKMMPRCRHIVEVGCGEGIGTLMLLADTKARVTAMDFDETQIDYAVQHVLPRGKDRVTFLRQDLIAAPYSGDLADGLVSLDVIEHIDPQEEDTFLRHSLACLEPNGIAVIGTPNLYAHQYASANSQRGHINVFDADRLASTMERYFRRVFLFSMNDEIVHTGFHKMAHYLIALCVK